METLKVWLVILGLAVTFLVQRSIMRLYFHPLSHIPGPRLAALTHLYEFYYDVIQGGQYLFQIEKMHQRYGPIVRLNPRHVHINDPSFYNEIYASGSRKREKDVEFVNASGVRESMAVTIDHDHHRFRRAILSNFFSKQSVLELSSVFNERVEKFMQRIDDFRRLETIIRLDTVFAALTLDLISSYSYGESWGALDAEDFHEDVHLAFNNSAELFHILRFFPWLLNLLRKIPISVLCFLLPGKKGIFQVQQKIRSLCTQALQRTAAGDGGGENMGKTSHGIFDKLVDPSLPPAERTLDRITDESFIVLLAGAYTTSRTLTVAMFYLISNKDILSSLRAEVKQVMPTPKSRASWLELEKLPYLVRRKTIFTQADLLVSTCLRIADVDPDDKRGVINESIRIGQLAVARLPRVAPDETLQYKQYAIPPGTPVSTSSYFMHFNPTIFPDPERFYPERWIQAAERGENLSQYISAFTRGSRMCLGINLAYMELYLTIATLVRRFDFELHNTTLADIRMTRDMGPGFTDNGEIRVSARVTNMFSE